MTKQIGEYFKDETVFNKILYKPFSINGFNMRVLGVRFLDESESEQWFYKSHKHVFYEFYYVVNGSYVTVMNGTGYEIKKGHFYRTPSGMMHSHFQPKNTSHSGLALRWEIVKPTGGDPYYFGEMKTLDDMFKENENLVLFDKFNILDSIINFLDELYDDEKNCELDLQLSFVKLLLKIADAYKKSSLDENEKSQNIYLSDNGIIKAINYMEANYHLRLHVKDIADAIHLSPSHLSRLFQQNLGISVMDKLMTIRIEKANDLLLYTESKLNDIADKTGFINENHFISCFKKTYGIPPGKYRKQNKCEVLL